MTQNFSVFCCNLQVLDLQSYNLLFSLLAYCYFHFLVGTAISFLAHGQPRVLPNEAQTFADANVANDQKTIAPRE